MLDFLKKLDVKLEKEPERRPARGQKFDQVKTPIRAWSLCEYGGLQALYCIPTELGGGTGEENILFLPAYAAEQKYAVDEKLVEMKNRGVLTGFSIQPQYEGESLVPTEIMVKAEGPEEFEKNIIVW